MWRRLKSRYCQSRGHRWTEKRAEGLDFDFVWKVCDRCKAVHEDDRHRLFAIAWARLGT